MRIRAKLALLALTPGGGLLPSPAAAQATETPAIAIPEREAVAAPELVTQEAALISNWVIATGDNRGRPFIIIDKLGAAVLVFDAQGQFLGSTPALLGITPGDESVPGIGDRELSAIRPDQRTTPAGRFEASFGRALGLRKVLWVDYSSAVALHPVVRGSKKDHRRERLQSPSAQDNRITYGCINIAASFFDQVVVRAFRKSAGGVVYTLPEIKSLNEVFPAFQFYGLQSMQAKADR
jgi:hypothetical protein